MARILVVDDDAEVLEHLARHALEDGLRHEIGGSADLLALFVKRPGERLKLFRLGCPASQKGKRVNP